MEIVETDTWCLWGFTPRAVRYNGSSYEDTICLELGSKQYHGGSLAGKLMHGGMLANTESIDEGYWCGYFTNWGETTTLRGDYINWSQSFSGGYGLHGGGICGDGCDGSLYFDYGSSCLSDGYSHTTTMYRFTGYKLNCISVTEDKKGGSGGTDKFYVYYGVSFNSTTAPTSSISSISVPTRTGYYFEGYYSANTGTNGTTQNGTLIIDKDGNIKVNNRYFTGNSTIYALWKPITYIVNVYDNEPNSATSDVVNIK